MSNSPREWSIRESCARHNWHYENRSHPSGEAPNADKQRLYKCLESRQERPQPRQRVTYIGNAAGSIPACHWNKFYTFQRNAYVRHSSAPSTPAPPPDWLRCDYQRLPSSRQLHTARGKPPGLTEKMRRVSYTRLHFACNQHAHSE